ncbi:hypothetical protein B0H14DRAFT_2612921 [Mycena olivaceomarginata]|nr:hypothetical protein B0H14DRAFT_2612921 [Mycena olivaceomarginata]
MANDFPEPVTPVAILSTSHALHNWANHWEKTAFHFNAPPPLVLMPPPVISGFEGKERGAEGHNSHFRQCYEPLHAPDSGPKGKEVCSWDSHFNRSFWRFRCVIDSACWWLQFNCQNHGVQMGSLWQLVVHTKLKATQCFLAGFEPMGFGQRVGLNLKVDGIRAHKEAGQLHFGRRSGWGATVVSKFDPGRRYSAVRLLAGSRDGIPKKGVFGLVPFGALLAAEKRKI